MLKFIAACMGVVAFAFFAMPVFFNVANERTTIIETAQIEAEIPSNEALIATNETSTGDINNEQTDFGAFLNDITPAAGQETAPVNEDFGAAFEEKPHPAL